MKKFDKYIPYLFVVFFIILTAILVHFVNAARSSYNGVVTENPYDKGNEYNEVIEKNRAQANMIGDLSLITVPGDSSLCKDIIFQLKDAETLEVIQPQGEVNAKILRPVTDKFDEEMILTLNSSQADGDNSDGYYHATYCFTQPGQWELRVKTQAAGKEFFMKKRVDIRS
jgi:nitrogen fixation protein FixH